MKPARTIDTSVPNAARMYDYWLGGKDNFAADRQAVERAARAVPQLPWLVRQNRSFLGRAVRFCVNAGITQFLDIGTGLPTMQAVHQVAGQLIADPHVVYVDNDPVVISHAQALLTAPHTAAVLGDLTRPEEFLGTEQVRRIIDFGRPLMVLVAAVLHFVPDDADPAGALAKLREAMAPGSYLLISHVEPLGDREVSGTARAGAARELIEIRNTMALTSRGRTREEIAAFFGGMTLMDPGLTEVWKWRPDDDTVVNASDVITIVGGVAKKD